MSRRFLLALSMIFIFQTSIARGDGTYRTKTGVFFDGLSSRNVPNNNLGWLVGVQGSRFLGTSPVFFGFEGDYGASGLSSSDNIFLLGGVLGVEGTAGHALFGFSGGFDYAQARVDNVGRFALKPEGYVGIVLGGGYRIIGTAGYLNVPNLGQFQGYTFGIRLDRKIEVSIRGVDD